MYTESLLLLGCLTLTATSKSVKSSTPPMGWNTYNAYNCNPSEQKVKSNAQGLIDLGLKQLGYNIVTPDCGWNARSRDGSNKLQWNTTLFPSGGKALGDYLHGLGLKFGLYSGAGYLQCGSTDIPGSLGYEDIDAQTFSSWGGDALKYDNCYATSKTTMVDSDSAEAQSPTRFQTMATSLESVDRSFQYFICQWGIGENVGEWASKIGNTWRMSNDIYNAWRSIWRITNQVVPYWRNTRPGAFPDMDMLIVGLNVLSTEEERFHFGMWAINKSPLVLGGVLDSKLSKTSLATVSNKEVIAINQDSLGKQAQLVRRHTVEEWDIWLGELSNARKVIGIANWRNQSQSASFNLSTLGIASATGCDVWAAKDVGSLSGIQNVNLAAHELRLWVLSNITTASAPPSTYYSAASATLAGSSSVTQCSSGDCLPTGKKVGNIGQGASVTFNSVTTKKAADKVLVGVDFINYDYAFTTAWDWGSNTRNNPDSRFADLLETSSRDTYLLPASLICSNYTDLGAPPLVTIAVNGGSPKRWAFPLSGGDWYETGRLLVEVDGFKAGSSNQLVFGNIGTAWAPDLVGIEIFE